MKNELDVRCVMSKDTVPVTGDEQAVYALLDIKAGNRAAISSLPANFGLVIDRSGSMDGEKMENLKEAVGYVVDHLKDTDLVSVTIFDDQVETLVPSQPAGNREAIKNKMASILARGGTQISDGLKAGLAEVEKGYAKDRVNRILLLTDGQTWDDEDACLKIADEALQQGIGITSIGLGVDWNEKLLLSIAERSRGNSHWIENPLAILDTFRQEVDGMQSVAATNLRVTVRMSPEAKAMRAHIASPMIVDISERAIRNNSVVADLGPFDGKRGQTMLIEAYIAPRKAGAFRIGQAEISYDVPSKGVQGERITTDILVTAAADSKATAKVNAEVMNLVEKVGAFKLQTRALSEAEAGNIAAATRKLQAAATMLLNMGEDGLAETMEKEILTLKKTGALTAAGTKKLEYGTRKLTQTMTQAMK